MMLTVSRFAVVLAALVALVSPAVGATSNGDQETTRKPLSHRVYADCDENDEDCEHFKHSAHRVIIADGDHHAIHFAGAGPHLAGGYLGVQLTDLTPELRTHFGVGEDNGVMISKVMEESPAWRAGLQVGDIITAMDSQRVGSGRSLARAIRAHQGGEPVTLEVWRDSRLESISATLEEHQPFLTAGRGVHILCDEGEEDCDVRLSILGGPHFDCNGAEECEAHIECTDGTCTCTVNDEVIDCEDLHQFHHDRD